MNVYVQFALFTSPVHLIHNGN